MIAAGATIAGIHDYVARAPGCRESMGKRFRSGNLNLRQTIGPPASMVFIDARARVLCCYRRLKRQRRQPGRAGEKRSMSPPGLPPPTTGIESSSGSNCVLQEA